MPYASSPIAVLCVVARLLRTVSLLQVNFECLCQLADLDFYDGHAACVRREVNAAFGGERCDLCAV